MKKIITTIILALLTSPAFADFELIKHSSKADNVERFFARGLSTNEKLFLVVTKELEIILTPMDHSSSRLSSEVTKVSFKFDENQPHICSYYPAAKRALIEGKSCREFLIYNIMDRNKVRVQYFNEDGEFVESTISLKGSSVAIKELISR